jgi:hypothetical protein
MFFLCNSHTSCVSKLPSCFSKRKASAVCKALSLTSLLLFGASLMYAQTSRGTVSGLAVDSTKAVVANANVELRNEQTQVTRSTTTNESGIYRFDAVDPGSYTVRVSASGFKALQVAPFQVAGGQVASVDAQLEIGAVSSTVEVTSQAAAIQTEAPVRGGSLTSTNIVSLPVASQNPVSLSLTLPGVSTNRYSFGVNTFSVNGARGRSNNFLIDGTENNDISVAGQAFEIKNPDAIQEVSVQTGNYDAEYGRAGGGVVNVITRGGTNDFHGTARYLIDSTFDDAPTNLDKTNPDVLKRGHPLAGTDQFFSGTFGGPVVRNRTFFFSSYQEERQVSTSQIGLTTFSAAGRAALRNLFPAGVNSRVDRLLDVTAGADANSQFSNIPVRGQSIQVGTLLRPYPSKIRDRQLLERVDHTFSERDLLSARYLFDSNVDPNGGTVSFNGFSTSFANSVHSALVTETHTFSPAVTNEFRLGYNRIYYFFPFDPTSPIAANIPTVTISGFTTSATNVTFGIPGTIPQGRIANNYELQDTFNYLHGSHSFRAGISLLNQRSKQAAPFNSRGSLSYFASTGSSPLENYIDDFGGSGGSAGRDIGSASYYPSLFRQAYFFQDRWRVTQNMTATLGVRYEYFGVPINSLRTPSYTGLFNIDPVTFTGPFSQPNTVDKDTNNWAPTIGLAYSPSGSGPMNIFGQKKTVFRAGYQMGYDSFFNNIASNAVASSPNNITTSQPSVASTANPRGLGNLSSQFPANATLTPLASQTLVIKNLVNPYYQRWSVGFQRELPGNFILDVSYVGSRGTKLFATEDLNPLVPISLQRFPAGLSASSPSLQNHTQGRLDPLQGARSIRTNGGDSTYHAAQFLVRRSLGSGLNLQMSYTRSKFIDNVSDIFATAGNGLTSTTSVPSGFGGLQIDKSVSLYDRPNRFTLSAVYELPFMRTQKSLLGHIVGGWQVSGLYSMESGAPVNILNGVDADGLGGGTNDRPNYNASGTPGVRAVPSSTSPTRFVNPDAGNAPIAPSSAMYIVAPVCTSSVPCAPFTLGRFTSRTPILNNLDMSLTKMINITERMHLEFRAEAYNIANHRQYGTRSISAFDANSSISIATNASTALPGRFLNPGFADGGARVMRYQIKFVF